MKKILVTGGAGYKGCVLVPKLLDAGYAVVVYDLMLFGDAGLAGVKSNPNLQVIKGDIRDIPAYTAALKGVNSVIHMACISNDPSFELDEGLSRTINYDCFEPMVVASKQAGVKRFIYVSSSSVYGVSEAPDVTEDHPLVPLTLYNKYKGMCEPLLFKHQSPDFVCVTLRPATVCGYSPRMRFDLTINILTNHAVNKKLITVFGGAQKRPNIHVDDVTELYVKMLEYPAALVAGEIFNVGYENFTVSELAQFVKNTVEQEFPEKAPIQVTTTPSNDNRSYHVSSKKIYDKLGWKPRLTIEDAVRGLCQAFKDGRFGNDTMSNESFVNVKVVKGLGLK
jgi:nucleoside-diphosphate-sugar epimerase